MLRVFPLGGLGEVGMNCMAIAQRDEAILVDCGVTFDDRGLGVDVVHPDFAPLDRLRVNVKAVVVTHGHEDHIGALPYLLKRYDVPIYGPPYALGLVKERLHEHEILRHARLIETAPGEAFDVGGFNVEPVRVTHSIADATALAIKTDIGTIIHTGDFKLDPDPPDGEQFDIARFTKLGDDGVKLLLSDSTNVDVEGATGSESDVGHVLETHVRDAPGAVIIAMFASNIHRLRMLGDIARVTGRKIVLLGRGVGTHTRVARATGYLPWPDDIVLPEEYARERPRKEILAIATGTQGEDRAALARLARADHPTFQVAPGDRVIMSARTIPGNEPEVYAILGQLIRRGVEVITARSSPGIHVSGHGHRPDQRKMIELTRPTSFIPVHGTIHHLTRHAELAREMGVANVGVTENGRVMEVTDRGLLLGETIGAGRVHIWMGQPIAPSVLKMRSWMAEQGVAFCVVDYRRPSTETPGSPDILLETRGVMDDERGPRDLEDAVNEVREALANAPGIATDDDRAEIARQAIRRALKHSRGMRPVTVVKVRR